MSEPNASAGSTQADEEQVIRQRVRELTNQALHGRFDPDSVREVVKAMTGIPVEDASADSARQAFSEAIRGLNEALLASAQATHSALEQLAAKGANYSDNDIKEAISSLGKLQADFVAAANRVGEAASGSLRREIFELAAQAQKVGADASVRVAGVMSEFAHRLGDVYREGAAGGFAAARDYSMRMAMLASGVLAGVADALRDQSQADKKK